MYLAGRTNLHGILTVETFLAALSKTRPFLHERGGLVRAPAGGGWGARWGYGAVAASSLVGADGLIFLLLAMTCWHVRAQRRQKGQPPMGVVSKKIIFLK